ncbi:hypothetical protein BH11MYX2_BH11MYX2_23860 [soil metagenome]
MLQGSEFAMGNDDIEPEDSGARYLGMLKGLEKELAAAPLVHLLPAGSVLGVVMYADAAEIKWPLRDATMFSPAVLGTQKDYYRKLGSAVLEGADQGMAELAVTRADRKFLVVIGDGNDTNPEAAKPGLTALRARALKAGIEPIVVIYKNAMSDPSSVIIALAPQAQTVSSADGIVSSFERQLAYGLAEPAPNVTPGGAICVACERTSWFANWRSQLAIGSVALLMAMGVWFVRRERM